jgi:hypothetical protein
MSKKSLSILFANLDKETRHYICRRIEHPERKDWPTAKQKKEVVEAKQNIGKPIKQKKR